VDFVNLGGRGETPSSAEPAPNGRVVASDREGTGAVRARGVQAQGRFFGSVPFPISGPCVNF